MIVLRNHKYGLLISLVTSVLLAVVLTFSLGEAQDHGDPGMGIPPWFKEDVEQDQSVLAFVNRGDYVTLYFDGFQESGYLEYHDRKLGTVVLLLGNIGGARRVKFLDKYVLACVTDLNAPRTTRFPGKKVRPEVRCTLKINGFGFFDKAGTNITIYLKGGKRLGRSTSRKFTGKLLSTTKDKKVICVRRHTRNKKNVTVENKMIDIRVEGIVGVSWVD